MLQEQHQSPGREHRPDPDINHQHGPAQVEQDPSEPANQTDRPHETTNPPPTPTPTVLTEFLHAPTLPAVAPLTHAFLAPALPSPAFLTPAPLTLPGAPKPAFLDRLALFLTRSGACHVAALPSAAQLLRDDEELTGDLVAHLAPLDPALRPGGTEFLEALPSAWDRPREGGALLAPPAWDEVTVLPGPDAVTIGELPPGPTPSASASAPVDIRHVELFDSEGLPRGTFDLPSIPRQNGGPTARLR